MFKKNINKTLNRFLSNKKTDNSLRTRILIPTLVSSLCEILIFLIIFISSLFLISTIMMHDSDSMGEAAAQISSSALEKQLKENIIIHVENIANLIDEKLYAIQCVTTLIAAAATDYYTNPRNYRPRHIETISEEETINKFSGPMLYVPRAIKTAAVLNEAAVAANIGDILEQISKWNSSITASYLAGESGYFIFVQKNDLQMDEYDARKRAWYITAKEKNTLCWSNIYADSSGLGPAITCAAPYYDMSGGSEVLKGVAGNGIVLSNFSNIIDTASPDENTIVFLLDSDGTKLFSSDGSGIKIDPVSNEIIAENLNMSKDSQLKDLAAAMSSKTSGIIKINFNGNDSYAAYYPLKMRDWSLGFIVDERQINDSLVKIKSDIGDLAVETKNEASMAIFYMLFVLVIISLLIISFRIRSVFKLSRRISTPISSLAKQVEQISGGNLDSEVSVVSKVDELLCLVKSFNGMKKRLHEYVDNLAATTAEKERMSAELEIAAKIQMSMLPQSISVDPAVKDYFELSAKMLPAKEVGGDFYDFYPIGFNQIAVVIGDVSGKGVFAAMFMIIAKTLIKNHLQAGLSPEAVVSKLNLQLCDNNEEDMFVSIWLGVFNPYNGRLIYVNAGHTPPLVKSGNFSFRFLSAHPHDLVAGAIENTVYHKRELTLANGDILFLYTDGVTEAMDASGLMYGENRLSAFLNTHYLLPLQNNLEQLYIDIAKFAGEFEQSDDITMLSLRYTKINNEEPEVLVETIDE